MPGTANWASNHGQWHDPRQEPKTSTLLNGHSDKLFPKFVFMPIGWCVFQSSSEKLLFGLFCLLFFFFFTVNGDQYRDTQCTENKRLWCAQL